MNKITCLFTLILFSASANAAQKLSFTGHLVHATGDLGVGDSFSGQFTFNPETPDTQGYLPNIPGLDSATRQYFQTYAQNQSSSISFNDGQPIAGTQEIGWSLVDNQQITLSSPAVGAILSSANPLTNYVRPGTYDVMFLKSSYPSPQPSPNPFGDFNPGTIFGITAFFAPNTFTLDGINSPGYQNIFANQPIFLGFEVYGLASNALGVFDSTVTSVPLPGAGWLFGSALAGLALRLGKRR